MSLSADRVPDADGLPSLVARAGGGAPAPGRETADYGSAAGELATLSCGVGLADRSGLTAVALEGPPAVVEAAVAELAGQVPAPGGAVVCGESWWCAVAPGRVIVVTAPENAMLLHGRLDWHRARHAGLRVRELGADHAVLGVLGRRAPELLAALGVYGETGDPRRVAPVHVHPVAGVEVVWVLRSDQEALAIVARADAARAWITVREAGRPWQLAVVGHDAVARYALAQRRAAL